MASIFQVVRRIEEFALAWSVLLIAMLTVSNVICRALLGFSLAFAEELCQFLVVALTFIGLSYAAGAGRHIRMTAIYDQLSQRWRKISLITVSATTCLLLALLTCYAVQYVATVRFLGTVSPVLQVPLYIIYSIVPLGLGLGAVQYGLTTLKNLSASELYLSYERLDQYEQAPGES
jgi:TRAP-type C4-dicarboxylate transport system permease small subunit